MRGKFKENRGKMNKLEASIIKIHQSISLDFFFFGISFREEKRTKRINKEKEGKGSNIDLGGYW